MQRALKILVKILVVTTIALIALVAFLQHSMRHHSQCNECSAVANLRTINTAQVTYLETSGGAYGTMADLIDERLLDDTLAGAMAGYHYTIVLNETRSDYTAEAVPISTKTGRYGYYTVPDARIRYSTNVSLAPRAMAGKSVR